MFSGKRALEGAGAPLLDRVAVGEGELEHGEEVAGGDKHHRLGAHFQPAGDLVVHLPPNSVRDPDSAGKPKDGSIRNQKNLPRHPDQILRILFLF